MFNTSIQKNKASLEKRTYQIQNTDAKAKETSKQINIINLYCAGLETANIPQLSDLPQLSDVPGLFDHKVNYGGMLKNFLLQIINSIETLLVGRECIDSIEVDIIKGLLKCTNIPGLNSDSFIDNIIHYAKHKSGGWFNYFNSVNYTQSIKNILAQLKLDPKSHKINEFSRLKIEEDYKTKNNLLPFIVALKEVIILSLSTDQTLFVSSLKLYYFENNLQLNFGSGELLFERDWGYQKIMTETFLIIKGIQLFQTHCEQIGENFNTAVDALINSLTSPYNEKTRFVYHGLWLTQQTATRPR